MNRFKELFSNRTIGFYIGLGAAVLALISGILFLILAQFANMVFTATHAMERTFLILTSVFMLLGAASQALSIWKDFKFAPLIPVVFYSVALGMHFYLTSFPLADLLTGVNFFGGSLSLAITFAILFAVSAIGAIVSCFMEQRKSEKETYTPFKAETAAKTESETAV